MWFDCQTMGFPLTRECPCDMSSLLDPMQRADVNILGKETLFQGWMRVDQYTLQHTLFEGGVSRVFTREVLVKGPASALLPYDPKRDCVCLIEQFRCATYAGGAENPWSIEMVAGLIGAGETPEDVARREALEEAGLTVKRVEPMGAGFSIPGGCDEYFHFFCGEVDLPDTGARVYGLPDEDENIRTHVLTREEAFRWMDEGRIQTLPTLFCLNWLARHTGRLQKIWAD